MVLDTLRVWNAFYLVVENDPSVNPGARAGINSLAMDIDGIVYQKTGPLDTDWTRIIIPSGGSVLNNYGSFYSTEDQTNDLPANLMTFNNQPVTNGVTINNSSQITFSHQGLYDLQFSVQIEKSGGGPADIEIWLRKNGNNIDWTNTAVNVQGNQQKFVAAWNFFEEVTANQYLEIAWYSADPTMALVTRPAQISPDRPAIPSIILTVDQISDL